MTPLILTLLILASTLFLFVTNWLRMDLVALLMLLALMLSGLISVEEALAGFSDPVVVMIAGLFVVGGAIMHTGLGQALGLQVARLSGTSEWRLILMLMLATASLSAVMSSTGTVAIFLPIAVSLARQTGVPVPRLLMPISFAAFLGGMLTLIATPPNLVASNTLKAAGHEGFGFFSFTLPGLVALAVAIVYMLLAGRFLLPGHSGPQTAQNAGALSVNDLLRTYQLRNNLSWFQLPAGSSLFGQPLSELNLSSRFGVQLLCVREPHRLREDHFHFCRAQTQLEPHQEILVMAPVRQLEAFAREFGLVEVRTNHEKHQIGNRYLGLAEVLLLPRSRLVGKTLSEFRFRDRYRLHVLAIQRQGKLLTENVGDLPLRFSDILLVQGPWRRLERLTLEQRDFSVLGLPPEAEKSHSHPVKMGLNLAWVGLMILSLLLGWLPAVGCILLTAVGLIISRCLSVEEAYRSINWEAVILIAAMLPMATALQNTGGTEALSQWLAESLSSLGPYSMITTLFVLTSGFSLFLSNTATAVLVAPIALQMAEGLGLSPEAFLMTVALAASSAFSTPVSSPVNTMVMSPGGYRFVDYVKVGLPLQALMLLVVLLVVPKLLPL